MKQTVLKIWGDLPSNFDEYLQQNNIEEVEVLETKNNSVAYFSERLLYI